MRESLLVAGIDSEAAAAESPLGEYGDAGVAALAAAAVAASAITAAAGSADRATVGASVVAAAIVATASTASTVCGDAGLTVGEQVMLRDITLARRMQAALGAEAVFR